MKLGELKQVHPHIWRGLQYLMAVDVCCGEYDEDYEFDEETSTAFPKWETLLATLGEVSVTQAMGHDTVKLSASLIIASDPVWEHLTSSIDDNMDIISMKLGPDAQGYSQFISEVFDGKFSAAIKEHQYG